jgi:hypothetical protein
MNPISSVFSISNLQHMLVPAHLLAAVGIVAIFSLVFKENKLFRLFEHIFLGLAAGYTFQINWTDVLRPQWWDPMWSHGQWWWVMIAPISLMFYGIYTRNFAWQARLLFGFLFGMVTGTVFQAFSSEYLPQVSASFKPIIPSATVSPAVAIDNIIFLVIMLSVATYFFFAFEQRSKPAKAASTAGRWLLMLSFGAIFGSTIMTREALLIDRIYFLLHDWMRLVR